MKLLAIAALTLTAIAVSMCPVSATVYVDSRSAGPIFDGNSWETAYHTIQQGLNDAVATSEEVWVAKGVYVEQITLKANVTLSGGYSGVGSARDIKVNVTVIDGRAADYAVIGANSSKIEGFSIRGSEYGVYCSSTAPTIANNIIAGNIRAGVYCFFASPIISNNIIYANRTGVECDVSSPTIVNNTIVANEDIGISCSAQSSPPVSNNIVAYNSTGIYKVTGGSGGPVLTRNDVSGNTTNYLNVAMGSTDITSNPQFASLSYGDFHLVVGSPCIDGGTSTSGMSTFDMDGQGRTNGSSVDIGADESYGETFNIVPRVVYVNVNAAAGGDGKTWASAYKTIQDGADDTLFYGGGQIWVAKGCYFEKIIMRPFANIYGGFVGTEPVWSARNAAANVTIIDAEDPHCMTVWGANYSTIDGFTIRGGLYGLFCYFAAPTVTNNIIIGNNKAGILCHTSSPIITNNNIVGNNTGICLIWASNPSVTNNIISFNGTYGIFNEGSYPVLSCNDMYGNGRGPYWNQAAGTGDIQLDPQFASYALGNFHIQSTSPCRNVGNSAAPGLPSTDFDGQARTQGVKPDIGVDESYGENYSITPRVIYVNTAAAPGGNGSSWGSAYQTIQAALDNTISGGGAQIWVALGTYNEALKMRPFVQMYGGFVGNESLLASRNPATNVTIVDSANSATSGRAVAGASVDTIDGFTIRGAYVGAQCAPGATLANNIITNNTGFGIITASAATITGNTVSGSETGIMCDAAVPTVTRNTVSGNTACGIVLHERGSITNNMVYGNVAGIYSDYSLATILNNTIVDNTGNGFWCGYDTSPIFTNNISAFNYRGAYADPNNYYGAASLSYNDVYGNTTNYSGLGGTSSISVDPELADRSGGDYHIQPNSPCINAGYNGASGLPSVDFDGQARINSVTVDIGADESYGESHTPSIKVKADSPYNGPGEDWDHAWHTIGSAVTAADVGDEIWVAIGTYAEKVPLKSGIIITGGYLGVDDTRKPYPKLTTIDAGGSGYAITAANSSTIDCFTVKGGATGIYCYYTSPIITNCIITGNTQYGVFAQSSTATIINNLITENNMGIYCASGASVSVINNTIAGNTSRGITTSGSSPVITNNIVASSPTGIFTFAGAPVLSHNDVYGCTTPYSPTSLSHPTDIAANPLFVSSAKDDYHIRPGSGCIDAGVLTGAPITDLDVNPRPLDGDSTPGAIVDIGCYEAPNNYVSIATAKGLANETPVGITDVICTAIFSGRLYVQTLDRIIGIGVLGTTGSTGTLLTVEGSMTTVNGERMINASVVRPGPDEVFPGPYFLNCNSLGGGPLGLQEGVTGWLLGNFFTYGGANNIGLLIRTSGIVENIGQGFFYLNGGGIFDDGSTSTKGVCVDWPFPDPMPADGAYVEMTAISGCKLSQGEAVRLLRPISASAVVTLSPP
ncbi:MAG: NosD domain-containing protein [Armatimonadota bacterium]|nr:NosD domain-containing protein [Armatimonadota bacterium]